MPNNNTKSVIPRGEQTNEVSYRRDNYGALKRENYIFKDTILCGAVTWKKHRDCVCITCHVID